MWQGESVRMDQGQTELLSGMGSCFVFERYPEITGKGKWGEETTSRIQLTDLRIAGDATEVRN